MGHLYAKAARGSIQFQAVGPGGHARPARDRERLGIAKIAKPRLVSTRAEAGLSWKTEAKMVRSLCGLADSSAAMASVAMPVFQ